MAEVLVQVLASGAIYLGSYHIYRVKKLVAVSRDVCEHLRLTNEWIAERLERSAPPRPVTQPDYYDWLIDEEQRIIDLLSQMQEEEKCVGDTSMDPPSSPELMGELRKSPKRARPLQAGEALVAKKTTNCPSCCTPPRVSPLDALVHGTLCCAFPACAPLLCSGTQHARFALRFACPFHAHLLSSCQTISSHCAILGPHFLEPCLGPAG